ncbi:FAD-dependent oxidoreductase [Actinomadura graeca]|uniref:FAD-dependent oxidoreductase n=1 Tax=Actinomadura graeca TaxID=2750812 RepID=A0ABX8QR03_9ACTN|nr:FAD-dependent oxidoreductase [Actinomadura graeca]QXJ21152.1 FAD-dependent oxidoreductase [Actinomadura graeca]
MANPAGAEERVVVVGAGQAGGWVAASLREHGHRGAVTLIGDEAYPPYERPPLSKEFLLGPMPAEQVAIKAASFYAGAGIDLWLGRKVTRLDRHRRVLSLHGGGEIRYDRLVLTTGARPRRLSVPGGTSERVLYLRGIADAERLRAVLADGRRLIVVGGGLIGMEVAAAAARRGLEVTVLEQAARLMERVLPAMVGDHLADVHAAHGVRLLLGARIHRIETGPRGVHVHLGDGDVVTAGHVVAGIGAVPNDELAAAAGIAVADGVLVDEFGATSDPRVYAAGDVARFHHPPLGHGIRLESWHNAQNQAIAVGRGLAGDRRPYEEVPWSWSDQYDVNVQVAGAVRGWPDPVCRRDPAGRGFTVVALRDGVPVAAATVDRPREMRPARALIARGRPVDRAALADPAVPLAALVRSGS